MRKSILIGLVFNFIVSENPVAAQIGFHVQGDQNVLFGDGLSGPGAKLIWTPQKSAFRAGNVGNTWDPDSIGINSAAFGSSNLAEASGTMAWGFSNRATRSGATVWGSYNVADGTASTVWGILNNSNGLRSTAWGESNNVTASYATAWGRSNIVNSFHSTVLGRYARTSGVNSPDTWIENDYLLVVGNGSNLVSRSNALTLLKNGNLGLGDIHPLYTLDVNGDLNLRTTQTGDIVLRVDDDEALWYNGTYYSWGFGADYNYFADEVRIGGSGSIAPNYQLFVDGNAGKVGSNTWDNPSDQRLKEKIRTYEAGLSEVLAIRPVTFHYNLRSGFDTKPEYVGIIAQELKEIAPYMVSEDERGYLSANTSALTYMLVNAVKELAKENASNNRAIQEQQKEIDALRQQMILLMKNQSGSIIANSNQRNIRAK